MSVATVTALTCSLAATVAFVVALLRAPVRRWAATPAGTVAAASRALLVTLLASAQSARASSVAAPATLATLVALSAREAHAALAKAPS